MRIASGGIQHETNTFSTTPTKLEDFIRDSECGSTLEGGETLLMRYRNTGSIHGGYISQCELDEIELLPLLSARAQPSGIVQQEAFEQMLEWFLERLESVMPVDGVLLDLHGAMVTEQEEDAESRIAGAVRKLVGPEVPIAVTLDLHANVSANLADLADIMIGFDTYPHVDMDERGREAVQLLARTIRGEIQPVLAYRQLPLITLPPKQCTLREPMQSLMRRIAELESRPNVLAASVSMGFPFADIADAGVSVFANVDGDPEVAKAVVDEMAEWLWKLREQLQPELSTIEQVIEEVQTTRVPGPVIFADGSDNPGGGAPCDGTVALQALIDAGFEGAVVAVLYDPETADQAHRAGVGQQIKVRLGGKTDNLHGQPVIATAYVRALSDGRFTHRGPMLRGVEDQMGLTATLVIGGVEVIVSSLRRQCLDAEMLRIAGVEPTHRRLIVLKSAVHFRADIGPLASQIHDADTPGIHRPDFQTFDYRRLRRPIFPLDNQQDCEFDGRINRIQKGT